MLLNIQNPIPRGFFVVALNQHISFLAIGIYIKLKGRFTVALGIFKNFGFAQVEGTLMSENVRSQWTMKCEHKIIV